MTRSFPRQVQHELKPMRPESVIRQVDPLPGARCRAPAGRPRAAPTVASLDVQDRSGSPRASGSLFSRISIPVSNSSASTRSNIGGPPSSMPRPGFRCSAPLTGSTLTADDIIVSDFSHVSVDGGTGLFPDTGFLSVQTF